MTPPAPETTSPPTRSLAAVESRMTPGDATPLHAHPEDEAVYVLEGSVTVYTGEESHHLTAGESFVVAAGVPHAYRANSKRVRYVATAFVSSVGRYEDFLRAVGPPAGEPGWPSLEEVAALTAIAAANGITVLGPPGALP